VSSGSKCALVGETPPVKVPNKAVGHWQQHDEQAKEQDRAAWGQTMQVTAPEHHLV
jgi:hypothetical protein